MENMLQVHNGPAGFAPQALNALGKVLRERHICEHSKIGGVQEIQPSLSLYPPELAVGIDDTVSWSVLAK